MMDEMLNQRATSAQAHHRSTVLNKNDAYSSSSNYTQNIVYNRSAAHQHCSHDLDDPSVTYYYSTSSATGQQPDHSQNPPQDISSPNDEDDTRSSIGNYTQNVAYKHTSGGAGACADEPEYTYCYSTNTAYGANAQGPCEVNVAYGARLEDRTGEEEEELEEEEEGEIEYYGTNDRQDTAETSSGGFTTGNIEAHYEVYRHLN